MAAALTIGLKVSWLARMLRTRFDARARTVGLTRAQWRMIATVNKEPGATQRRLAAVLEINTVTAGRILDRLEAAACIERRADPVDRRANRVYLTPSAKPLLTTLSALGAEEEQIALKGITPEERDILGDLLQRILDNVQNAGVPELPDPDGDPDTCPDTGDMGPLEQDAPA